MGWADDPREVAAAAEAKRQAEEAVANRPLSAFERRLLGQLDDAVDALRATVEAVRECIPRPLDAIEGTIETVSPEPYFVMVGDRTGAEVQTFVIPAATLLHNLGESPGPILADVYAEATDALLSFDPSLADEYSAQGLRRIAEVVIEAALKVSAGQAVAAESSPSGEAPASPSPDGPPAGPPAASPPE